MSAIRVEIGISELIEDKYAYYKEAFASYIEWVVSDQEELEIRPSSEWKEERDRIKEFFLAKDERSLFMLTISIYGEEVSQEVVPSITCDDDVYEVIEQIRFAAKEAAFLNCWF